MSYILNGLDNNCDKSLGGVSAFWVADWNWIKWKFENNNYKNGITDFFLPKGQPSDDFIFRRYDLKKIGVEYSVGQSETDKGVHTFNHSINFRYNKRSLTLHKEFTNLTMRGKKVVVLVKDRNDNYFLLGWWSGLKMGSGSGGSGSREGSSHYSYTLDGVAPWFEQEVDEDLLTALNAIDLIEKFI